MNKRTLIKTLVMISALLISNTLFYSDALARTSSKYRPGRDHYRAPHRDYDKSCNSGFFGLQFFFTPKIGNIVVRLPMGYQTIVVRDQRYYRHNEMYYKKCPTGYIIIPESDLYSSTKYVTIIDKRQSVKLDETLTVNIPNSNGSYTSVTLSKFDSGYIGPQGEYYPGNPTVEQLRILYDK